MIQPLNEKNQSQMMFIVESSSKVLSNWFEETMGYEFYFHFVHIYECFSIVNEEEEQAKQDESSTSIKNSLTYHQEQEQLRKRLVKSLSVC